MVHLPPDRLSSEELTSGGDGLLAAAGGAGELLTGQGMMAPGPTATFRSPIPNMPSIFAMPLTVQALHSGTVTPFALSNAFNLTIGF